MKFSLLTKCKKTHTYEQLCGEYLELTGLRIRSRDDSFGIAAIYALDDSGKAQRPDRLWGPPGMERPERESEYSPPSNAEFMNCEVVPPLPHTF